MPQPHRDTSRAPLKGDDHPNTTFDQAIPSSTHAVKQSSAQSTRSPTSKSDALSAALRSARPSQPPANVSALSNTSGLTMNGGQDDASRGSRLAAPTQHNVPRAKSPSHAAALAATAKAVAARADGASTSKRQPTQPLVSTQTKPSIAVKPRRLSIQRSPSIDSPTDTTSIAPTTSLVSLFEDKSKPTSPATSGTAHSPAIASSRPSHGSGSVLQGEVGTLERATSISRAPFEEKSRQEDIVVAPLQTTRSNHDREDRTSQNKGSANSGVNKLGTISSADNARRQGDDRGAGTVAGSASRQIRAAVEPQDRGRQAGQVSSIRTSAQEGLSPASALQSKAPALPPRKAVPKPQRRDTDLPATQDTLRPVSRTATAPIDILPRRQPSSEPLSTSGQSSQSVNATYRQLYPARHATTLTKDDELANAIVASSLASSRLSSPQRRDPPPLPPSRRHSQHGRSIFHSRTPSPAKAGLRQTLRKQESSTSDSEDSSHPYNKHRKKRLIRKYPNKHHEGDRKRWRDAVTEAERKRYEGVWAANKGLHVPSLIPDPAKRGNLDPSTEQVSAIVTKDIWGRSRLPDYELGAVWDLVDSQNNGRLSKEEFVVGMWLIDQRLKGRKLPVKVTATVWQSVRGLQGIKVRKP